MRTVYSAVINKDASFAVNSSGTLWYLERPLEWLFLCGREFNIEGSSRLDMEFLITVLDLEVVVSGPAAAAIRARESDIMASLRSRKSKGRVWWEGASTSVQGKAARCEGWWPWLCPG